MRISRVACFTLCLMAGAIDASAQDPVFDARGFDPHRSFFNQVPFEHIDPLTGNVLLTFVDLVLPGNAGFDLRIQRTYNSKIYKNYDTQGDFPREDSWAGIGWTFHQGRVIHGLTSDAAWPVIEMPDGSLHQTFPHITPVPSGCSPCFITREYWIYDKDDFKLTLPNGTVYTFLHSAQIGTDGLPALYATRIEDTFGNFVTISYMTGANDPPDGIATITQDLGGQIRTVTFGASPTNKSLSSMTYLGRTWTYNQTGAGIVNYSLLNSVVPPVGGPNWTYTYTTTGNPRFELTRVTSPHGGWINYTYSDQDFNLGVTYPVTTRSMTLRATGGRDITAGSWTYAYAQGGSNNETLITGPNNSIRYTFLGVGTYSSQGEVWRIGLPSSIVTTGAGSTLQTDTLTWDPSVAISPEQLIVGFNVDPDVFVPLLKTRTIARGADSFSTTNTYHTTNFNDYGRPYSISETGQLSRTTAVGFQYGFTPYIVDKIQSETVTVGGESFTKSYGYNSVNGFMTSQSIYGVTTTFGPTGRGNVSTSTNARSYTTTFSYSWGAVSNIQTPEYSISRGVNTDGTISSETRRGFTTTFSYDNLQRPTVTTPPVGNSSTTSYDNTGGTFIQVVRGPSQSTTSLDGFGRVSGTENNAGVKTDFTFDADGRRTYESYPFTTSNIGTTLQFDGLSRIKQRTGIDPIRWTV